MLNFHRMNGRMASPSYMVIGYFTSSVLFKLVFVLAVAATGADDVATTA